MWTVFIRRMRAPLYPGGLFASKGGEGFKTVMRIAAYVRSGGTVGLLADLADWGGVQVPFFGHMMWATTAPAWLARRAGTRLWVGRVARIGKESRFKIAFHGDESPAHGPAPTRTSGDDGSDTEAIRGLDSRAPRAVDVVEQALEESRMPGGTQD